MITIMDELKLLKDKKYYLDKLKLIQEELDLEGDITIKIGEEKEAIQLNKKYRQMDYAPDVLSFPLNDELPRGFYLGDIFICFTVAKKQAVENDHSLEEELLILMIHGILHLKGYDHENDSGAMQKKQDILLAKVYR